METYYNKYNDGDLLTEVDDDIFYINLGKYRGSANPESLTIVDKIYPVSDTANVGQSLRMSIGNNAFTNVPVWKIVDGNLEILSVREGGGDAEETNLYKIMALGPDTLCYKTIGKLRDEEETFEYNRYKEKPAVDLRGLQLEDTQDEFNKI